MPLGPWELGIILLIVLAIFGAGKLSHVGGALGTSIKEFRHAARDAHDDDVPDEPQRTTTHL